MIDPNIFAGKVDEAERFSREVSTLTKENQELRDALRWLTYMTGGLFNENSGTFNAVVRHG